MKFVAVNCWWPKGVCRDSMKFLSYPELYMYHTGVADGYRFTGTVETICSTRGKQKVRGLCQ